MKPAFLITIDTEGDNLWACPREITTENSKFLPRFQHLCEKYGFKPTWLTNWEMVQCPVYREFAADCLRRNTAEIGMHLHAWNNPPIESLTEDDYRWHPFLIQFNERQMRDKIACITDRLEDVFGVKMLSHRAGRWAFNETYARLLVERGYIVDCSVTPHVKWAHEHPSWPCVADYRNFPDAAYFMDQGDIAKPARSATLLQLPVTIRHQTRGHLMRSLEGLANIHSLSRRILNRLAPTTHWLRPDGHNRRRMLKVVDHALLTGHNYVEFMLHSSEFMPGGSPRFPNPRSIDRLFADMEKLFAHASQKFEGLTLTEFHNRLLSTASITTTRAA